MLYINTIAFICGTDPRVVSGLFPLGGRKKKNTTILTTPEGDTTLKEGPRAAASRIFEEQTGVVVPVEQWYQVHTLARIAGGATAYYTTSLTKKQTLELMRKHGDADTGVGVFDWMECSPRECVEDGVNPELQFMIPMAFHQLVRANLLVMDDILEDENAE